MSISKLCGFTYIDQNRFIIFYPLMKLFRKVTPTMSRTEQEALEAGHGNREMPIWGETFANAENVDEVMVPKKIYQLIGRDVLQITIKKPLIVH